MCGLRLFRNAKSSPCHEPDSELLAIERSAQQMPLEREMLPDRSVARAKFPCAVRVSKAAHSTLALACRWVAILRKRLAAPPAKAGAPEGL
jgi:hypothetical protein